MFLDTWNVVIAYAIRIIIGKKLGAIYNNKTKTKMYIIQMYMKLWLQDIFML